MFHHAGFEFAAACIARPLMPGMRRLRRILADAGAPLLGRPDLTQPEVQHLLASTRPDLVVSWFWTKRIPMEVVRSAAGGGVNVHPSMLPRYRGPDPYFWTVLRGETETGVTVHRITAQYDEGPVLLQRAVTVPDGLDAWQLARRLDLPSLRAPLRRRDGPARRHPRPRGHPPGRVARHHGAAPHRRRLRAPLDRPGRPCAAAGARSMARARRLHRVRRRDGGGAAGVAVDVVGAGLRPGRHGAHPPRASPWCAPTGPSCSTPRARRTATRCSGAPRWPRCFPASRRCRPRLLRSGRAPTGKSDRAAQRDASVARRGGEDGLYARRDTATQRGDADRQRGEGRLSGRRSRALGIVPGHALRPRARRRLDAVSRRMP
jgi:hypothetical protein